MNTKRVSEMHLDRALRVTPLASQTASKAPGRVGPRVESIETAGESGYPLFAVRGDGARVFDVDGRRYIDCFGANAAIPLGYNFEPVVEAVSSAVSRGSLLSLPHTMEAHVSEKFLDRVAPWAGQVRWTKTGSEATHAAYRIAKAATGRSLVLAGDWAYHGWHEWSQTHKVEHVDGLAAAGLAKYEYGADIEQIYGACWRNIAAIFVEPNRWLKPPVGWLERVREFCHRTGALLVFDEMVYGLRWRVGGSVEYYDVVPDLACFGKAIGNGVPVACVCGPTEIMRHTFAAGVSGTYGGDVIGLAAADAVLDHYASGDTIRALWSNGGRIWREFAATANGAGRLEGEPVHWRLVMDDAAQLDRALLLAARAGVLVHRSSNNASAVMSDDDADIAGRVLGQSAYTAVAEAR